MTGTARHFVTYTGIRLPFRLVNELQEHEIQNRNTFFRGYFDTQDRITGFDMFSCGELELAHRYEYHGNGKLKQVEITGIDGEATVLEFDAEGNPA